MEEALEAQFMSGENERDRLLLEIAQLRTALVMARDWIKQDIQEAWYPDDDQTQGAYYATMRVIGRALGEQLKPSVCDE